MDVDRSDDRTEFPAPRTGDVAEELDRDGAVGVGMLDRLHTCRNNALWSPTPVTPQITL